MEHGYRRNADQGLYVIIDEVTNKVVYQVITPKIMCSLVDYSEQIPSNHEHFNLLSSVIHNDIEKLNN
jgi:hypothetical protein